MKTPVLIPSFSSKGFPGLSGIVEFACEYLADVTLVSAYDIYHEKLSIDEITKLRSSVELTFLDSGGYEASKDYEFADAYRPAHSVKKWIPAHHNKVIAKWDQTSPSVIVSFDRPAERKLLAKQVEAAAKLKTRCPGALIELLIKPEKVGARLIDVPSLVANAPSLKIFDVIGLTEKELGSSCIDRMCNVAKVRDALDSAGISAPIHIFGSLDTVSTCLYFVAGAEIFDGLSWLRFAFYNGKTLYINTLAAESVNGASNLLKSDQQLTAHTWSQNIYYINDLRAQMNNFISSGGEFSSFKYDRDLLKEAWNVLTGRLLGG